MEKLMGVEELAEALGIKLKTLYIWIQNDRYNLKSYLFKVGNSWRIDQVNYEQFIEDMKGGN